MSAADVEDRSPTDWPLYWFASLEKALDNGNLEVAARAQRELARLGVHVQFCRRQPREVAHA